MVETVSVVWELREQGRALRLCTTGGLRLDTPGGADCVWELLDELCLGTQNDRDKISLGLDRIRGTHGDGWFIHVGGADTAGLLTHARRFAAGVVFDRWLRTLESTFPARPDPELLTFVPLLVLPPCAIGQTLKASRRPSSMARRWVPGTLPMRPSSS